MSTLSESTVSAAKTETFGTRELSAWLVAPGVTWIQTRSPQFARKLSERSDSRLVMRGVAGGYLRTFEFQHGLAWAERLIARYTGTVTATNAPVLMPASPPVRGNSKTVKSSTPSEQFNRQTEMLRGDEGIVRSGTGEVARQNEATTGLGVYQESTGAVLFPPTGEASNG